MRGNFPRGAPFPLCKRIESSQTAANFGPIFARSWLHDLTLWPFGAPMKTKYGLFSEQRPKFFFLCCSVPNFVDNANRNRYSRGSMARLNREDLRYCTAERRCLDCYQNQVDTPATQTQKRRKYVIPCCSGHYHQYLHKLSLQDAKKYKVGAARKHAQGECVSKGCSCHVIPVGILSPALREKTCGFHAKGKEPSRTTIARVIIEHCYTPKERDGMIPQSIQFCKNYGLVVFTARVKNGYVTDVFTMRSLFQLKATSPS